jgi:hypothetical protein
MLRHGIEYAGCACGAAPVGTTIPPYKRFHAATHEPPADFPGKRITRHTAFRGEIRIGLIARADTLDFAGEDPLAREPLRIGLPRPSPQAMPNRKPRVFGFRRCARRANSGQAGRDAARDGGWIKPPGVLQSKTPKMKNGRDAVFHPRKG